MTRQRMKQLRKAVDQGRAVAAVVIPFVPFTAEEQADYERRMDARDDADGPEEDREWEVRE